MPRGAERERAILAAALSIVGEVGYDATTTDAVARRAGASKATIYRRWPNKAALVRAALDTLDAEDASSVPDTGALRTDLLAVLDHLREKASTPYVALLTELALAARRDPELAEALREHVEDESLSPFAEALARAVVRGELPPDVDGGLVHDVAEALILRQIQVGAPLDAEFALRVVDGVLLPLLHRTPR